MYRFTPSFTDPAGSPIRELHKHLGKPGMLSFAAGYPDSSLFDVEGLQRASARAYQDSGKCLQYGATEGLPVLRGELLKLMARRGSRVPEDSLLVTTGSQQGFDLLLRVLVSAGDRVLVEQPTYPATLQALRLQGAVIDPMPIDEHGLRMDALAEYLSAEPRQAKPKMLYLVPTFGNPSGATLTEARRLKLLELAVDHKILLVEDDPYGELRFSGPAVPSLLALAPRVPGATDWIVHLSSLSKVAAGGLRIGWMVGPREVIRRCTIAKQTADLCTSPWSQAIAAEYLSGGEFDGHLPSTARMYGLKCAHLSAELRRAFGADIVFNEPEGGMFVWARFPGKSARDLLDRALANNVVFVPGDAFFHASPIRDAARLSFAGCSLDEITEGVSRLRRAADETPTFQPAAVAA